MGNLAMRQLESANGCGFFECVREGFEVKVGGLLQVGKRFLFSATLAGSANFRALGNEQVGFGIRINDCR